MGELKWVRYVYPISLGEVSVPIFLGKVKWVSNVYPILLGIIKWVKLTLPFVNG